MQNDIRVFESSEFGKLEVLTVDGKPFFPATECATILGYNQPEHAVKRHCKGCTFHTLLTAGGNQQKKYIPEGDLYRLIIRSKLPAAEKFESWVFDEVLPSIRKHGAYVTDDMLDSLIDNPESAVKLLAKLKGEREKKAALEGQVKILKPKGRYYDIILQCPGAVLASVIAKDYGYTCIAFNKLLHALGVQFRYSTNKTWMLYKEHDNKGYTITRTYYYDNGRAYILMC